MSGTKSLAYQRVFVWHIRPFGWPMWPNIKLLQHVLRSRWKLFLVLRFFLLFFQFLFLVFTSQFQDNVYWYSSHTTNFTQAQEHPFFLSFRNTHLPFWNYIYPPKILRQQYMLFLLIFDYLAYYLFVVRMTVGSKITENT